MTPSSSPTTAVASAGGSISRMRRHPVLFYLLLAFGLTWIYEVIFLLLLHLPLNPWLIPTPFVGPTFSAFLMTAITQGSAGVRRLLGRYLLWQVPPQWYVVALFALPALMFLGTLLAAGGLSAFHASLTPLVVGSYYITDLFLGGPLGEEPGWRGFALPRLQRKMSPLGGTLLLGVLWGFWHLPLYLRPVYLAAIRVQQAGADVLGLSVAFVGSLLALTALAVIFTWVFNHTKGSLLLMMLLAESVNTGGFFVTQSFPSLYLTRVFNTPALNLILDLVPLVPTLLLIALTHGRLGYDNYQQEAEALDLPSGMQEQPAPKSTARRP